MNRALLLVVLLAVAVLAFVVMRHRHPEANPADGLANIAEAPGLQVKPIHELRARDTSGATEYLVRNLIGGPIQVRCTLEDADNVRTDPPMPRSLVVPAFGESYVATFQVIDPSRPNARGRIACGAMIGDPAAQPSTQALYALPFPSGTRFTLEQGFGGSFSHADAESRYALDLGVPEGTPVLAARAGVVMQVEEDFRAHGADARYGDRANFVRVLHDDGSMALYAHLSPASLLSRPGERVVLGQMLGKSGNTGLSTGPHLHFSIQRNAGMALVSIPFAMQGVDPARTRD